METETVSDVDDVASIIVPDDTNDLDREAVEELWEIWEGRDFEEYIIVLPNWLAESSFDRRWPVLLGDSEYDNEDKGAVLFGDAYLVDRNVIANGIWDQTEMTEALQKIDLVDDEDAHVDEPGLIWVPRSQMTVIEKGVNLAEATVRSTE